jgi:integrase/recombinase XerD
MRTDKQETVRTPVQQIDHGLIMRFLDGLWVERGLSANTLASYRNDLQGLAAWLAARHKTLMSAGRDDLLAYLACRVKHGAKPRSTARFLSTIRRLYQALVQEAWTTFT